MTINTWGSEDPAEVAKGGTGNATLTDHGVLLGSGTAAVTPTASPTDGQLLIGSTGVDPALAVPTGDTDEISIGTGSGSLSIGIADNPVLPGNESVTITDGTTAQEPTPVDGMIRYDTDTDKLRAVENGVWLNVITGSGGAGSLIFLDETVVSGASEVEWLNTLITDTFDHYIMYVFNFTNSVEMTGINIQLRVSNDNGVSFASTGYFSETGNVTTEIRILTTLQINNAGFAFGFFHIFSPTNASLKTTAVGELAGGRPIDSSEQSAIHLPRGYYNTAEDNDALQITTNDGTFSGTFRLYGVSD